MSIDVTTRGGKFKRQALGFQGRYEQLQRRKIDKWLVRLKNKIRLGNFFKDPTPSLQQHVWASPARGNLAMLSGSAGWGDSYGPILEFGVEPKNQGGWEIKPRKTGGLLRFQVGNAIVYSRGVFHPWNHGDKGSAPHWEPELEKMRSKIVSDLSVTVKEALR